MAHIFISHSSRDREFVVDQLKPALEAHDFTAWCSSTDLKSAANWEQQIRAALASSDWFIVVLSPDAQRSEWVQAETHWALENLSGRVIPVMVRNCRPIDLHLRLGTLQFVNFQIDFQMAMRELLALLQIHPDDAIIRGGLLTAADGSEPTTLVLQSHQVSLLIRIVRPSAPEYQDHLQVHNSATIGRSPQAHLQIDDRCVSRRHARIDVVTVNEGAYVTVMDLGSANGTFLNGELLQTPRRIVKGDTLALGNCELQILDIA